MKSVVLFVVLTYLRLDSVEAEVQSITVKGTTLCNNQRMPFARIELIERDHIDPDDNLDTKWSNSEGQFLVMGKEDEHLKITPALRITHTCNVKPGCKRVTSFVVPRNFINGVYDMTYVALNIIGKDDKDQC